MKMVSEMDAGPIIDQQVFQLGWSDTVVDLIERIKVETPGWSLESIDAYIHGELVEELQEESQVSYCTKIAKADGCVVLDPYA